MRDNQRTAVYRWERQIIRKYESGELLPENARPQFTLMDTLTPAECADLLDDVWTRYKLAKFPYPLHFPEYRRTATFGRLSGITLPRWARQPWAVLHEVAHALTPGEKHGPIFARVLLDLLVYYCGFKKGEIKTIGIHQKPRRVRFASPKDAPQPYKERRL